MTDADGCRKGKHGTETPTKWTILYYTGPIAVSFTLPLLWAGDLNMICCEEVQLKQMDPIDMWSYVLVHQEILKIHSFCYDHCRLTQLTDKHVLHLHIGVLCVRVPWKCVDAYMCAVRDIVCAIINLVALCVWSLRRATLPCWLSQIRNSAVQLNIGLNRLGDINTLCAWSDQRDKQLWCMIWCP